MHNFSFDSGFKNQSFYDIVLSKYSVNIFYMPVFFDTKIFFCSFKRIDESFENYYMKEDEVSFANITLKSQNSITDFVIC